MRVFCSVSAVSVIPLVGVALVEEVGVAPLVGIAAVVEVAVEAVDVTGPVKEYQS